MPNAPHCSRPLSREEVRTLDARAERELGLSVLVLMENAGRGIAEILLRQPLDGPVWICAGKGNNGGDGFVVARHLKNAGVDVRVLMGCPPHELSGAAALNYQILERAGWNLPLLPGAALDDGELAANLNGAAWIVDALLGTGARPPIRDPYARMIRAMNEAGRPLLAVDLPSGLDCDTGRPLGPCVQATQTVTFVAPKLGFTQPESHTWTGPVHVLDIGLPWPLYPS